MLYLSVVCIPVHVSKVSAVSRVTNMHLNLVSADGFSSL